MSMDTKAQTATETPSEVRLPPLALRHRMSGRNIHDAHRTSSPLEALFDLTTVIAVAATATRLHHDLASAHHWQAVIDLGVSFFTIWWAWMNFTWFSSAYDTDDIGYRLAAAVQMIGALVVAVGIEQGAEGQLTATLGYTVSRVALILLWLRAARENPERGATCLRYAYGLIVIQSLWLARLFLLDSVFSLPSFFGMVVLELALPAWAERAGHSPWHPHHIAERYALFTIILLGECLVAAANTVKGTLAATGWSASLMIVSIASVGVILGLWWTYFMVPFAQVLHLRRTRAFLWGYGHALVFMVLTTLASEWEVMADVLQATLAHASGAKPEIHEAVPPVLAIALMACSIEAFLATLWWLGAQTTQRAERSPLVLLPSVLIAAMAVAGVAQGLPATYALLVLSACPASLIAIVWCRRLLHPERFAVR